jgi:hypothetical protein
VWDATNHPPHVQDHTGRLPAHDQDHNKHDYTHSDKQLHQLYMVMCNTAGYVTSTHTAGTQAAEAAPEAVEAADHLQEHGESINNLLHELQKEVQCPM